MVRPGGTRIDPEERHAFVPRLAVGLGYHHQIVGDVGGADVELLAGEAIAIAVAHRARLDAGGIRSRVGLRQRKGRLQFAGADLRQVAPPEMLSRRELQMHAAIDDGRQVERRRAAVVPRQRLDQHDEILAAAAHAAIGRIVRQRHVARLRQRIERRVRKRRLLVEPPDLLRRQHASQQFGDVAPDQDLFVGQAEFVESAHLGFVSWR
jgi:hypothetical protein